MGGIKLLLKELTSICGVSGNEENVKNFILEIVNKYADELIEDDIGNLIAVKRCKSSKDKVAKKVMLSAHMDEVGFMVSEITDKGMLKFIQVGGVDERIIPGILVQVGPGKIPGLCIENNGLLIDIGATNSVEAMEIVELGEYVAFSSNFVELGNKLVMAKAFDDRAGCAVIIEMLKGDYDFDLYACFTVQEEVGLRGSEVAAYRVKPDIAFVIEGTTCSDISNVDPLDYSTIMGNGPAISILDRTTYYHMDLHNYIKKFAMENNIKLQVKNTFTGGNDSGRIQRSNEGVKVAVISVPVRYIHSPTSVMSLSDYEETIKLVKSLLTKMDISKI